MTSCIKQSVIVVLVLFSITMASAQDVRYYKLTKKKENGSVSSNVSGGQFITFRGDVCYESNKNGVGVDHGTMQRNENYSNSQYLVYQQKSGSGCYWGKDATFKFTADKSELNVVLENGDVYLYKRTTAPIGQETCSLIRKSGGGGSSVVVTPPVNPGGQVVVPPISPTTPSNPGGTTPTPTHGREPHQVTKSCMLCGGSGKCNTCNGKHWYYFAGNKLICPNCPPSGACQSCGGSGKKTTTEWW